MSFGSERVEIEKKMKIIRIVIDFITNPILMELGFKGDWK